MVGIKKSEKYSNYIFGSEDDWKAGSDVFTQLTADTYGKCYICEDSMSVLNVDHVKPRSKYPAQEHALCWNNLLPACKDHCNMLKGNRFEHIINPAITEPEDKIRLSLGLDSVVVETCDNEPSTLETAALLECVFNAKSLNVSWKTKCRKLRGKVETNMKVFLAYTECIGDDTYDELVRQEIQRASPFAAFKRQIIRDNVTWYSCFKDALL